MRKYLLGIGLALAGVICIAVSAMAADLPPAPTYKAQPSGAPLTWTGAYLGLGLGVRSTFVDGVVTSASAQGAVTLNLLDPTFCVNPCTGGQALDHAAFRITPYGGYNWQVGSFWLVGLEADWGSANGERSLSGMFYPGWSPQLVPGSGDASFAARSDWDASIRARLGALFAPILLFYATGGPAWLHVEQTSSCPTNLASFCNTVGPGNFTPSLIHDSTTRMGWTVGGGMEAVFWSNWIARADYRYADFGTWSPPTFAPVRRRAAPSHSVPPPTQR